MIVINPGSIHDLCMLAEHGAPVTLTSHPGNASLYKLSLWSAGIPETLWDVTCCQADRNNWPMYRLYGGTAELLVEESVHEYIKRTACKERRFVTAYQKTKTGERLGRVHVRQMQQIAPRVISSCSRLLLSERDRVHDLFAYLAETCPEKVFTRFITSEGVALPVVESGVRSQEYADSFMGVLVELERLLFSDEPFEAKGGVCYEGFIAPLAVMLVQYWQTGHIDRYDISGPDMIHYATRPDYQQSLRDMLTHIRRWNPALVPPHIAGQMYDGTVARVGYIPGHVSEEVMQRKTEALVKAKDYPSEQKRALMERAIEDERIWPIKIDPSAMPYFSQHDLSTKGVLVDEYWKKVPLPVMRQALAQANSTLRIKSGAPIGA